MSRAYFEEVQKFRDSAWIWILSLLISIATLLPLVIGANKQLIQGEPWGKTPMSNNGLIGLILFMLVTWGLLMFMLFSLKLETKIDEEGVHYRFSPLFRNWQLVTPGQIAEYKLEKRFRFFDAGGIGYHRSLIRNTKSFRIQGSKHLYIKLSDGLRLRIGTQNLNGVEWAMNRLMKREEHI